MNGKTEDFVQNTGKSGGKPRLKFGGRVLVAVGILALIVGIVVKIGDGVEVEDEVKQGNELEVGVVQGNDLDHPSLPPSPPPTPTPTISSNSTSNSTSRGTFVYAVVDSKNKVHTAFKASEDIRVVGFVGRAKAIVEVSEKGKAILEANPRLTFEGVPGKTFKDVKLRAGELTVVPLRTEDLELIERVVTANGGEVKSRCGVMENPDLRIVATDETIAALMALPEARWIENYERPVFFNHDSARKMQVNDCWPTSAGDDCGTAGLGLTGAGQLITTSDTGIDTGNLETMHLDLKPNVIGVNVSYPNYAADYDMYSHGTHTAGSMVGVGAMTDPEGYYRGMAYGAKLWAWMCGAKDGSGGSYIVEPINYAFRPPDYIESYSKSGMISHLYSASYGSDGSDYRGRYLATTKSIDDYCWNNPDFLPVWAAANSGEEGETTLAAQACAKNALVVGASNGDEVASFSSRGPTKDGRTKPDVCSPGKSVYSCNSTVGRYADYGYYVSMNGTSMATPLTAGVCALLREWLIRNRGFNETDKLPSSALMKAILMGGAIDLGAKKSQQGVGRVNLRSSIAPDDGCEVYLKDRIPFAEGSKTVFTFTTTEPKPLDAQLVWIDYPGDYTADQSVTKLINDLDLVLYDDTGKRLAYGNGGSEPDRLNNAEAIHQTSLPAGTYKLFVNSNNIPYDSEQGGAAAIYLKGAFDASDVKVRSANQPIRIIVR